MNTTFLKRIAAGALAMMLSMAALPLSAAAQEEPVALKETDVTLDQTEFTYTGSEIRPNVTVRSGENLLTLDTHYTLELRDNVEVGQGLVVVTGVEAAGYTGTVEHPFTIVAAEAEPVEIQGTDVWMDGTDFPYTGKPITPAITAGYTGTVEHPFTIVAAEAEPVEIQGTDVWMDGTDFPYTGKPITPAITVTVEGKTLVQDTDYTVTYQNNVEPGTAEAVVQGMGDYTGTVEMPFTTVTVEGKTLVQDTDYTVTYQNNVEPGTAEAVVQGMGDYTGTVEMPFTIQQPQEPEQPPVELTKENVSLEGSRFPYTGKPITPAVTVTADGKTLTEGSDYTLTYQDNEKPGMGDYTGTVEMPFTIQQPQEPEQPPVELTKENVSLEGSRFPYTGKPITPAVTVTADGKTLTEGSDYTLTYQDNEKPGTATVTVEGKGGYTHGGGQGRLYRQGYAELHHF